MISKLHYISQGETVEDHLTNIQSACSAGAEWVQLRLRNIDPKTLLATAKKAREITAHFQTRLIINDYYKVAKEVNADGAYLEDVDDCPLKVRNYLGKFYSVGAKANTLEDCKKLINKKIDYISYAPFQSLEIKSNKNVGLGTLGYQDLLEELKTETPVIAIGGIVLEDVSSLLNIGVFGIAVSEAITNNFNSIPLFNSALNALSTNEMVYKFTEE